MKGSPPLVLRMMGYPPGMRLFCWEDILTSVLPYLSVTDFVLLDDSLHVKATYIGGEEVWRK